MTSLRGRLVRMLLLTLAPLGLLTAAGTYEFVRRSMLARLNDGLEARAEALGAAVKWNGRSVELDAEDVNTPQYGEGVEHRGRPAAYFEIYRLEGSGAGALLARSKSLGPAELLASRRISESAETWDADVPGDVDARVLAKRMKPSVEIDDRKQAGSSEGAAAADVPDVLVVVAVSRETVDEPLRALLAGLGVAGVVFIAAGWCSLRWAVTRGLAPVVGLAEQVARIDAGRLDSRLDAAGLPSEMTPIQEGVNTLLERIDEAMQREKRFTMAAAHELRTPVAELRMLLEVSAARPRTLEESERTVAAALSSVLRLDRLVSDLLRLSRLERGRESTNLSDVSIADLVRAAVEDSRALADARKVRFEFTPAEDRVVRVDAGLLKLGVGNLIANAAQYADEGSCVQIAMTDGSAGVVVRIENAASEFQPDDAARLGEPLWRGDRARSDAGHLGLGLTIARAALAASGAGLRIGWTGEGGGCVVAEVAIGHQ